MAIFQRVDAERAGPRALGVLIPPGRRTLVILRPRGMDWDLVLLKPDAPELAAAQFWELSQWEASGMTHRTLRALQEWAGAGNGATAVVPAAEDNGYHVRVASGPLAWAVCRRVPGQPYRPATFATSPEAEAVATELTKVLCPAAEDHQEIYFNTRHFTR